MYRFLVVKEKANGNYSAYSPDLPGCVATGASREEAEVNMRQAMEMHVRGLIEDGLPVPQRHAFAGYIEIARQKKESAMSNNGFLEKAGQALTKAIDFATGKDVKAICEFVDSIKRQELRSFGHSYLGCQG